jgi:peptide/nickel transport system permease protein
VSRSVLATEDFPQRPELVDDVGVGRDSVWRSVLRAREGRLGLALLGVVLVVIVFGPSLAPYSPYNTLAGPALDGPSAQHWFGTDALGRDVWSRVLCGGRQIVWLPLLGIILAFLVGGVFGVLAGFRGGWFDSVFTRGTDVLLALPPLLLVLVIVGGMGYTTEVIVISLGIVFAPRVARVVRGAAQAASQSEYVDAARIRGESSFSIAYRELAPNLTGPLSVEFAVRYTHAIIFVATLNFLGLGDQPPSPNWGLMVSDGRTVMSIQPMAALGPALAIAILVIGVNLVADAGAHALARDVGDE